MATAEIDYIVLESDQNNETIDQLVESIDQLNSTFETKVPHAYEISQGEKTTSIKVSRIILNRLMYAEVQEDAEVLRRLVESHFPEEDRERLQKRFAGIGIYGDLEIE